MVEQQDTLSKTLKPSRIWFAVIIGLGITAWMFYRSFSEVSFVKVKSGGTYSWVDANGNQKIDLHDRKDFEYNPKGDFRIQTATEVLKHITWNGKTLFWLFAALLFTLGRDFFYMLRIRLLTKSHLSWKASFYVIMLWEFASALTPGVVGGAAVAMFILNRESIAFGRATAIVIITAFMDNLFYVVMIPLVLITVGQAAFLDLGGNSSLFLAWWFWTGFGIIMAICLFLYLSIFWFPHLAGKFLLAIFSLPFIKRWKFVAREWGKDIAIAAEEFQAEKRSYWIKIFLTTMGSWMSRYLVINAVLNAFIDLGFLQNIIVLGKQLILWLFMLVSPTPGGSGVAEFAFGELLSDLTDSAILLAALALIWRLISYFPYLLIGSLLLPSWIKRTR